MGDGCYMEVTCRRQDAKRFEELGFTIQTDGDSFLVEMVEEEANYAHHGDMPKDVPYHGSNGTGSGYGSGEFACDGKTFREVYTGHNDGYMVGWEVRKNRPYPSAVREVRQFIALEKRTKKILAQQAAAERKICEPRQRRSALAAAEHPFHSC